MRGSKQAPVFLTLTALLGAAAQAEPPRPTPLPLPGGEAGIGFDDLRYSPGSPTATPAASRQPELAVGDHDGATTHFH
jgi:hypothetical protein